MLASISTQETRTKNANQLLEHAQQIPQNLGSQLSAVDYVDVYIKLVPDTRRNMKSAKQL